MLITINAEILIEALECPFCKNGSVHVAKSSTWREESKKYNVYCPSCYCEGPMCSSEKSAVELWNMR